MLLEIEFILNGSKNMEVGSFIKHLSIFSSVYDELFNDADKSFSLVRTEDLWF